MPNFIAQQTLHGYINGHQLVAASAALDRADAASMQIMSDLSGPAFQRGFETYLTAYPLSTSYCVARTWFAPEQQRPGCVWTHSLLVDFADLAQLTGVDRLLGFFQRPSSESPDFGAYEAALQIDDYEVYTQGRAAFVPDSVLRGLYSSDAMVVIACEDARQYEAAVVAIFSQQWPKLRRTFRFCTGALSLRDSEFDISVSPPTVTHSARTRGLVIDPRKPSVEGQEEWLIAAQKDLQAGGGELRTFLWRYGSQLQGRASYSPLVEVFLAVDGDPELVDPARLLTIISHFFPGSEVASLLKLDLFGEPQVAMLAREERTIEALVTHPSSSAIPPQVAALRRRAVGLVNADFGAACRLADVAIEIDTPHASEFVAGFLDACFANVERFTAAPIRLVISALQRDASVAYERSLWKRQLNEQIVLVSNIWESQSADFATVVRTLVEVGADATLAYAIRLAGRTGVLALLEQIDRSNDDVIDVPASIPALLHDQSALLLDLLDGAKLGPRAVLLIASVIDLRSSTLRRVDAQRWVSAATSNIRLLDADMDLSARALFLCAALNSRGSHERVLLQAGFLHVWQALERNLIDVRKWWVIEGTLPWVFARTPTERLVRGTLEFMISRQWPPIEFFNIFSTPSLSRVAALELKNSWRGRSFFERVKSALLVDGFSVSAELRAPFDR